MTHKQHCAEIKMSFFKKLFSREKAGPQISVESVTISERPHKMDIEQYFKEELESCDLIKRDCHELVLQHLTHKINLNKTGNKLSVEEKRSRGINTRLQITHELISVLTEKGLAQECPRAILESLFYRGTFAQSHDDDIKQYKEMGVRKFKLLACCDERDCDWCQSMDGKKLSIETDLNQLIKDNCTCESHCRLCMTAVIN